MSERRLLGKVAVITGGARGIGAATVRLFTKHGAKVIIADIAEDAGKSLAEALSPCATYVHCDVSRQEDVSAAVDAAVDAHGHLDVVFNSAGAIDTFQRGKTLAEYDMAQFERVMNINVKGVMHGLKHAARVMIPRQNGCIISMASTSGIIGAAGPHAYTASKNAVIGLTKNGAAELGNYGIRVNCISPFGVATALAMETFTSGASCISEEEKAQIEADTRALANLRGVTLTAEDVAEAGLYLASDDAKYVSGHNLAVDGGFSVVNHSLRFFRS